MQFSYSLYLINFLITTEIMQTLLIFLKKFKKLYCMSNKYKENLNFKLKRFCISL